MVYHTNRYNFGYGVQTDPYPVTETWIIHRLTNKELKVEFFGFGNKNEFECSKR